MSTFRRVSQAKPAYNDRAANTSEGLREFKRHSSLQPRIGAMAPSILTNLGCAGGAAVITVTFIHPIDTVKTRLQVSGTGNARNYAELGLAGTCSTIAKEEGIAAFWKGIPAAWMREEHGWLSVEPEHFVFAPNLVSATVNAIRAFTTLTLTKDSGSSSTPEAVASGTSPCSSLRTSALT